MQPLSAQERVLLDRYRKCSSAVDRFTVVQVSALASNKLLTVIETSFIGRELTRSDYAFLQALAQRRAKNFLKLSDVKETLDIFTRLRDGALAAIGLEEP